MAEVRTINGDAFEPLPENVAELNNITSLDIPVERVLRNAANAGLRAVVVVGETEDGERYFQSSMSGGPEVLWMLEVNKHALLNVDLLPGPKDL